MLGVCDSLQANKVVSVSVDLALGLKTKEEAEQLLAGCYSTGRDAQVIKRAVELMIADCPLAGRPDCRGDRGTQSYLAMADHEV